MALTFTPPQLCSGIHRATYYAVWFFWLFATPKFYAAETPTRPMEPSSVAITPELEKTFIKEWLKDLTEFSSTREHAHFVKRQAITIRFVDDLENSYAVYDEGAIKLNREIWHTWLEYFMVMDPEKYLRTMALKTLPILVHEIRHAITMIYLSQRHLDFPPTCLEEEVLAFKDQGMSAAEISNKYPHIFKEYAAYYHPMPTPNLDIDHRLMIRAWALGGEGIPPLVYSVAHSYSRIPILVGDQGESLAMLENVRQSLQNALSQAKMENQRTDSKTQPGQLPSVLNMIERRLQRVSRAILILSDPIQRQALIEFYHEQIKSMAQAQEKTRTNWIQAAHKRMQKNIETLGLLIPKGELFEAERPLLEFMDDFDLLPSEEKYAWHHRKEYPYFREMIPYLLEHVRKQTYESYEIQALEELMGWFGIDAKMELKEVYQRLTRTYLNEARQMAEEYGIEISLNKAKEFARKCGMDIDKDIVQIRKVLGKHPVYRIVHGLEN